MYRRVGVFNPKRTVDLFVSREQLEDWASRVSYGGNPEHKRNPGDFGLTPPSDPRPDKALCDRVGVFRRAEALQLLQDGLRRGLVSAQRRGGWPQQAWSLTRGRVPVEFQLENADTGRYHGYPLPENDPFREEVLDSWGRRHASV